MVSLMCSKCGSCFPKNVWKAHKSHTNLFYYCPDCKTRHHWNNLKKCQKKLD